MESNTEWLFCWKEHIFMAHLSGQQLCLNWTLLLPESTSDAEADALESPEHLMSSTQDAGSTESLDLPHDKDFTILASGFSFDPGCLAKVPVIILGANCASVSKHKGSRRSVICLLFSVVPKAVNLISLKSPTKFELLKLRTFYLSKKFRDVSEISSSKGNVSIACFFHLMYLSAASLTLELYSTAGISSYSLLHNDEHPPSSQIYIVDIFSNHATHETFLILLYGDDRDDKHYRCIKIQHRNSDLSLDVAHQATPAQNLNVEIVPLQYLLPLDYSPLVCAMKVISLSSQGKYHDDHVRYSSSLMIITCTGYLMRFLNGAMTAYINLWESVQQEENNITELDWNAGKISFITTKRGSTERTAVLLNSFCFLIDWEMEKVIKIWPSVHLMCGTNMKHKNCADLILLLNHSDKNDKDLQDLMKLKENLQIIDFYNTLRLEGEGESVPHQQNSEKSLKLPQCAVDALLAQKKKHELSVREAKAELSAKEQFLVKTWEQLQQLSQSRAKRDHTHSQLVPLCGEISNETKPDQPKVNKTLSFTEKRFTRSKPGVSQDRQSHIEVAGEPWKRTIGSLLIVGVQIKNVGDRPVTGAHTHLIPSSPCSFSMLESVSGTETSFSATSNDNSQQPCSSLDSIHHTSLPRSSCVIQPGSQKTLTCYVDTAQLFSPDELRLFLFSTYCVNSGSEKGGQEIDFFCGEVNLQTQDMISATFGLEQAFRSKERDSPVQYHHDQSTFSQTLVHHHQHESTTQPPHQSTTIHHRHHQFTNTTTAITSPPLVHHQSTTTSSTQLPTQVYHQSITAITSPTTPSQVHHHHHQSTNAITIHQQFTTATTSPLPPSPVHYHHHQSTTCPLLLSPLHHYQHHMTTISTPLVHNHHHGPLPEPPLAHHHHLSTTSLLSPQHHQFTTTTTSPIPPRPVHH
ncbi:hypothetical protein PoB_000585600 [Plakobranchus ocellatus]|uniref:DUF3668 domain-containing protein n=1 Tax=Plakobranchus ocellatus TaxID=259542 RepID=A0AAV3Y810_9GAST|nr:hypothetical protein PoB_000585600 [Plakobranchus ocellatus]